MRVNCFSKFIIMVFSGILVGFIDSKKSDPVWEEIIQMGNRREIFLDYFLIDKLDGLSLELHTPEDKGIVLNYDQPWEIFSPAYVTILKDKYLYRAYYRSGIRGDRKPYTNEEWTCYAESKDGINWEKPALGLFEFEGSRKNNIVLANEAPVHHNFSPFIDNNPKAMPEQKYKALGGTSRESIGLIAYSSPDGINWKKMQEEGVIKKGAFDSQNVAFWSESEEQYICYFRIFTKEGRFRSISRATSKDFIHWSEPVEMTYGDAPYEHLYIQQTSPYFRAPHIYVAIGARLLPNRQIGTLEQLTELKVDPNQHKGLAEPYIMTTRGGHVYDRTFMEAFIRPGIGLNNWVARTNFPALNVVQTGPEEMSVYVNQDYTQPTAHLRRYAMRLDGFSSIHANYNGGTVITKPFTFSGEQLELNFSTAAAGEIRIEIQDEHGIPIPGFTMEESAELIGNEIAKIASWKNGKSLISLATKPIRLHIYMKDADLYSLKFN
ncbi:MAG: hypothetical protein WD398_06000 [Cyclobacteriaceae bacterium]